MATVVLVTPGARAADTLSVVLDQATIMKLPEKVSTIVVGNPLIADVAVQSGGLVVVTGKGYGSTNLIALDRAGTVLMERSIIVKGAAGPNVQVYRGMERETYSCAPNCERRITLGIGNLLHHHARPVRRARQFGERGGRARALALRAPRAILVSER